MSSALEKAEKLIPAEFRMISGCKDEQTSADVSNVATFKLPDPAGQAGGACTSAMLKVLYADHAKPDKDLSFQEVLLAMRDILSQGQYAQIPQLTSSRPLDLQNQFSLVPDNFSGTKRALMIGINYIGQDGELSGCHNDVGNMMEYIKDVHGFPESNITLLMDDGQHTEPTFENIMNAYKTLVASSQAGDAVFCHYSGHGGKIRDESGDEADGYDETLVPLDYESAGQIRDDDLFQALVGEMPAGVTVTCIMDCCHSGTVLDLPYHFVADGDATSTPANMSIPDDYDFAKLTALATKLAAALAAGGGTNAAINIIAAEAGCGSGCVIL